MRLLEHAGERTDGHIDHFMHQGLTTRLHPVTCVKSLHVHAAVAGILQLVHATREGLNPTDI